MTKKNAKTRNYQGRDFRKQRSEDRLTKEKRSALMSKIRSKNTRFEQEFVSLLKKRLRRKLDLHLRDIRGTPDLVFRKQKICVFLDSDFWHGWQYPRWKHQLKNDFWREKIERNRQRDVRVTQNLRRNGWMVMRFWEHELRKDAEGAIRRIEQALKLKDKAQST